MAITPNITSPGIEITETDLSLIARESNGNTVFVTGFASQGPTDEIVNIGSVSELENVFGQPKNGAERYFYHTSKQILQQSPANLLVSRLPYGPNNGDGFSNKYSVLLFPISAETRVFTPYPLTTLKTLSADLLYSIELIDASYSRYSEVSASLVDLINEINSGNFSATADSLVAGVTLSNILSTLSFNRISLDELSFLEEINTFSEYQGASATTTQSTLYSDVTSYGILPPISMLLNEEDYQRLVSGEIKWSEDSVSLNSGAITITDIDDLQDINIGMVVVNPSKLTVNSLQEGYYIGLGDNTDINPNTTYDKITGMQVISEVVYDTVQRFKTIEASRLSFSLTSEANSTGTSISQIIEENPVEYNIGSDFFNDTLSLVYFKVRSSIYAQDTVKLEAYKQRGFTGSLYSKRNQNNPNGGNPIPFGLTKVVQSSDVKILINPNISEKGNWIDENGKVLKKVRISKGAQNLYPLGVQNKETDDGSSIIGNLPLKLERVLQRLDDLDVDLDLVAEAGLGTIWAGTKVLASYNGETENSYTFNDSTPVPTTDLESLRSSEFDVSKPLKNYYDDIANRFISFAEAIPSRKDHLFIADPLRYIFVNGQDFKVSKRAGYNHSSFVYWPLRNLYADKVSSYAATYGNWLKTSDVFSGEDVWLPPSGFVVADMVRSAAVSAPWAAPAGFSRGILFNVKDLAINPTQKHRDQLYKVNVNPIAFFPGDGYVIFGQKTLYNKPSAFDRINVRRLFLVLEKTTKNLLKYFIFEPNTFATRARLVQTLAPIFNRAKNNDGLYDYRIICDERNNTPDVIDQNQLKVSIYIQPVRTAEFILADFIATRTGVNFDEITS